MASSLSLVPLNSLNGVHAIVGTLLLSQFAVHIKTAEPQSYFMSSTSNRAASECLGYNTYGMPHLTIKGTRTASGAHPSHNRQNQRPNHSEVYL
jgi:hypothetical protein